MRSLSRARKEVLIKSVLQSIPMNTMSCFMFLVGLYRELEQIMCRFLWCDGGHKKGIHWMSWDMMCLPKSKEGLGFHNLEDFNLALLAR